MMPECPATSENSGTLKQFCYAISMASGAKLHITGAFAGWFWCFQHETITDNPNTSTIKTINGIIAHVTKTCL